MKKSNFIVAGGILLSVAAFYGCNNAEAIKAAQDAAAARLTAVTDSLQGAFQSEKDALKATYDSQIQALNDSLNAKTAALEAVLAKKAAPAAKPKTSTTPPKPKVTSR